MPVIESKVTAATSGAAGAAVLANFVLWVLTQYVFHAAAPEPVVSVVNVASAAIGAFVLGYAAKRTPDPKAPVG